MLAAPIYVVWGWPAVPWHMRRGLWRSRPVDGVAGDCLRGLGRAKWAYWLRIDGELRTYTAEAATGLGHLGKVRVLEPPHTQPNFVMREMGYRVARKHALKLRRLALLFAFGLPIAFLLLSQTGAFVLASALAAALSMAVGLVTERWLFFAEAEHVAMLYYGADAA
jgi:DMSO reductase anchor subunit